MKICLLVDRYPPQPHSGIGTFVQVLARGLHRRGHKVTVLDTSDDKTSEHFDDGIPVFTLKHNRRPYIGNLITRIRMRRWLADRYAAGEIDIIEEADYPGYLSFGLSDCPTVVRLHQSDTVWSVLTGDKATRGVWFYEKRNLIANPNWIGVSGHIVDLTKKTFNISPKRSVVIHNPAPAYPASLPQISGLPDNFVLFAGSVATRKGAIILAHAAREFLSSHLDLHLVYAGGVRGEGGRDVAEEIRRIVGPDLTKRVHFLGQVDRGKVLACMKRARVFAFPALFDCFPMSVLEAMSSGVPVVFTTRPPGPEMIEDGVTGLLANPDSSTDVSEKISQLLDNPEFGRTLANNAREVVRNRFSLDNCLEATERFYEECIAHRD